MKVTDNNDARLQPEIEIDCGLSTVFVIYREMLSGTRTTQRKMIV